MYGEDGRRYLREAGLPSVHAHMIWLSYRNGLLHNQRSHSLIYKNKLVAANLMCRWGTGGISAYNAGFTSDEFPELNLPAEKILHISEYEANKISLTIVLDRLAALVRYDITQRLAQNRSRAVFMVTRGLRIDENAPRRLRDNSSS